MFEGFFSPRPTPLTVTFTNTSRGCSSWYGHSFRKFDESTIFCPTCGESKTVKK